MQLIPLHTNANFRSLRCHWKGSFT